MLAALIAVYSDAPTRPLALHTRRGVLPRLVAYYVEGARGVSSPGCARLDALPLVA
jgi:hypothetical protein